MNRTLATGHILLAAGVALSVVSALAAATPPPPRPNIVFILADDLGYGDLGCYGCRDIHTPVIDRLAAEGVRFTSYYANGPECTPTRTALMTGRYQQRVGGLECAIGVGNVGRYDDAIRLAGQHDLGLPAEQNQLLRGLKQSGYPAAICGKWHLGYEDKFSPNRHGFDYALYCVGGGMDYFHHVEDPPNYLPALRLNGQPIKRPGYFTDLVAEDSVRFIKEQAGKPFFLYVPFTAPHAPYQGPSDSLSQPLPADSPLWSQSKGPPQIYAAIVERLDQAVGRILAALSEKAISDRTLLIFASDNGGTASARPCALRGLKGTTFEGGIRVPCIVRWPGVLPKGAVTEQPAITMDLTASILRAAGAHGLPGQTLDGIDILEQIERGGPPQPRTLLWRQRRGENTWRAVRDGNLKLVSRRQGDKTEEYLFDLARDLAEESNLLSARPEDAARLKRLLADWEREVQHHR
jgi:N-acetylgalactosamine-6-sulfatase